jgi:hypothetical protein
MARELFGGETENSGTAHGGQPGQAAPGGNPFNIDMEAFMRLNSILNSRRPQDSRAALIEAIKPHLTEPSRRKADQALGFLRAIEIIPILREAGI